MAIFRNMMLVFLLQVFVYVAECSVQFSSKPRAINVAETTPLKMECAFSTEDRDVILENVNVDDLEIQSIAINKLTQGRHQAVAFIHSFTPDSPKILTTLNQNKNDTAAIFVSGKINQSFSKSQNKAIQPASFLSIQLASPKPQDSGDYSCVVTVINKNNGLPHTFTKDIFIPDESTLGLAREIDSLEQSLEIELTQKVRNLELKYNTYYTPEQKANEKKLKSLNSWKERVMRYLNALFKFIRSPEYKNTTYMISDYIVHTMNEGQTICALMGGYLFEFDDKDEFDFVTNFIKSKYPGVTYFIGGSDGEQEGDYRWMRSNQPLKYRPWAPNEPNNKRDEDCLELSHGDNHYWLNDVPCEVPQYSQQRDSVICEIPN